MDDENWLQKNWRPLAAAVYLIINLFDFIVAPVWIGMTKETTAEFAKAIAGLDPTVQAILAQPKPGWQPLTLLGSGLFHMSFGAILGVAAWTRGSEKVETLRLNAAAAANPAQIVPAPPGLPGAPGVPGAPGPQIQYVAYQQPPNAPPGVYPPQYWPGNESSDVTTRTYETYTPTVARTTAAAKPQTAETPDDPDSE